MIDCGNKLTLASVSSRDSPRIKNNVRNKYIFSNFSSNCFLEIVWGEGFQKWNEFKNNIRNKENGCSGMNNYFCRFPYLQIKINTSDFISGGINKKDLFLSKHEIMFFLIKAFWERHLFGKSLPLLIIQSSYLIL